jgi:hypothetical protein
MSRSLLDRLRKLTGTGAVNNSPLIDYVDIPFKVENDDPVDTAGLPDR